MHILYLYQFFSTRKDVGHTRAYEFAKRFVAQGHQVTVLTAGADKDMTKPVETSMVEGIEVIRLRSSYSNYLVGNKLSYLARLRVFLGFLWRSTLYGIRTKVSGRADVLYATSPPLTIAVPALLISTARSIPLVFEVRDCWPEAPIQLGVLRQPLLIHLSKALEGLVYRASRHIVALSPGMREVILQTTETPATKVSVVPNCADLDLFHPGIEGRNVRERLGLQDNFVCLYFGAMGEANGLSALLEVFERVQARGEAGITLLLCGAGKERENLEAETRRRGLKNVVFTGPLPKEAMPEMVAAADLCFSHFKALPILGTCSPNKLFDALSAGKPVLDNSVGWISELLEVNEAGLSVSPADPEAFADALITLSQEPERLHRYGQNARALAEREFDRRKQAERLIEILAQAAFPSRH